MGLYPSSRLTALKSRIFSNCTTCRKFQLTTMSTSATVARAIWSMSLRNRAARIPRASYTAATSNASSLTTKNYCPEIEEFCILHAYRFWSEMDFYGDDFGEHRTEKPL